MTSIWIDGDACPKPIREILFKAAKRKEIKCIFVANQSMNLPASPLIQLIIVERGYDKADDYIAESVQKDDIVITSDLPLAESCLKKQSQVISPRGELFTENTIRQKLAIRDFNESMRSSGIHSGGQKPMSAKDINLFANQLDRLLARL